MKHCCGPESGRPGAIRAVAAVAIAGFMLRTAAASVAPLAKRAAEGPLAEADDEK